MNEADVESRLIGLMAENLARVQRPEDVERIALELGEANRLPADLVAAVSARIRLQFETQLLSTAAVDDSDVNAPTISFPRLRVDWGQNLTVGRQVCPQFHVDSPPEFTGPPEIDVMIDDRLDRPPHGRHFTVSRDADGLWEFDVPFGLTTNGDDCRPGRYKLEIRAAFPSAAAGLPRYFHCLIYLNVLHPDESHGPTLEIEGDGQSIVNLHGGELSRFSTVRLKGGDRSVVNVQDLGPSEQAVSAETEHLAEPPTTCEYTFRVDELRQQSPADGCRT